MPDKFKCESGEAGYCNRRKQRCMGWRHCPINGYGAPCPHCYLPKENTEPPYGRLISKVSEERLINTIIDYYIHEDKTVIVPTFKQVYQEWRAIKDLELSGNSALRYNSDYARFFQGSDFENLAMNQINENTIRKFMLETIQRLGLCRESCKKMFSYIQNTVKYARIEKIITDNPVEFLELKQFSKHCIEKKKANEEQFFSDNELLMIQKGLNELYGNRPMFIPRYGVEMAMLTGMRVGEIAALKWEDIHEDYILIHSSVKHNRLTNEFYLDTTKTKKSRQFPMCNEIADLLERIRKVQEKYYTYDTSNLTEKQKIIQERNAKVTNPT